MDEVLEDDDEELEEEADAEVEKVLYEITDGKLGAAGSVKDELPVIHSLVLIIVSDRCSRLSKKLPTQKKRGILKSIRSN